MLNYQRIISPSTLARTTTLVLAIACNHSFAKQCDEPFENPVTDAYWDIEKPRLERETYFDLHELADKLDGKWRGTAIEIDCGVSDGTPLTIVENYDIEAEIEQHHRGAIIVRAEKESRRKVQLENLFIAPEIELEIEKLNRGEENGLPGYTIEFSTPDTLVFDHKYRARNVDPEGTLNNNLNYWGRGSRLVHEIKTVSIGDSQLTINRDVYVNGIFVSQQEWKLEKI